MRRAEVHRDRAAPARAKRGREVRGAATELDDVQPGDIAQQAELLLAVLEQPQVIPMRSTSHPRRCR